MYVVNICHKQQPIVIRGILGVIQVNPKVITLYYLTMVVGDGVTIYTATPLGLALGSQVGLPFVGTSPKRGPKTKVT